MHPSNRIHSDELRRRYARHDRIEGLKTVLLLVLGVAIIVLGAWFESAL